MREISNQLEKNWDNPLFPWLCGERVYPWKMLKEYNLEIGSLEMENIVIITIQLETGWLVLLMPCAVVVQKKNF